jgi:hypothetical protein
MLYRLFAVEGYIQRVDDNGKIWIIPNDPNNYDWQKYQQWLTELDENNNPNQPLPAE